MPFGIQVKNTVWGRLSSLHKLCLTCIIHESFGFVNNHPQQIENFCCGFRQAQDHELAEWPEGRIIHESEVSS